MPEEGIPFMPHGEILTYEEILRLVKLCIRLWQKQEQAKHWMPPDVSDIVPFNLTLLSPNVWVPYSSFEYFILKEAKKCGMLQNVIFVVTVW
jgi:hypothetical protein